LGSVESKGTVEGEWLIHVERNGTTIPFPENQLGKWFAPGEHVVCDLDGRMGIIASIDVEGVAMIMQRKASPKQITEQMAFLKQRGQPNPPGRSDVQVDEQPTDLMQSAPSQDIPSFRCLSDLFEVCIALSFSSH
jgi:hypothetical protein